MRKPQITRHPIDIRSDFSSIIIIDPPSKINRNMFVNRETQSYYFTHDSNGQMTPTLRRTALP